LSLAAHSFDSWVGSLGAVIHVVPFALAASATVLLLLLSVRIVVVLSLNITLGAALFDSFGFWNTNLLSSLVFVSMMRRNKMGTRENNERYIRRQNTGYIEHYIAIEKDRWRHRDVHAFYNNSPLPRVLLIATDRRRSKVKQFLVDTNFT
jgi:hypothetical protein